MASTMSGRERNWKALADHLLLALTDALNERDRTRAEMDRIKREWYVPPYHRTGGTTVFDVNDGNYDTRREGEENDQHDA